MEDPDEAMTAEEIAGAAAPRNAFAELMTAKPKKSAASPSSSSRLKSLKMWRDGLGVYIDKPKSFPSSIVIYHNDDFVAIHDRYPKSSVHVLLLPRSTTQSRLHPFEALKDEKFRSSVEAEVARLRILVASELQRRFGAGSRTEATRQAALDGEVDPGTELPPGRDWEAEVISGIHAHPSMNHLHIHVLSRDMHSDALKHKKHYNSFNTPFLIDVADFPLAEDDRRLHPTREGYLQGDMVCWRCGKNFQTHFTKLKEHLAEEFEEWKSE